MPLTTEQATLAKADSRESGTDGHNYGLRKGVLSPLETLAQAVAGVAPSATPGLLVPLVFASAGAGTCLTYLIATAGVLLVASCINQFGRRLATPGSLYKYVHDLSASRWGESVGWALLFSYFFLPACCFVEVALMGISLTKHILPTQIVTLFLIVASAIGIGLIAYKNIKLSAVVMLRIEMLSMLIISLLIGLTLWQHGFKVDTSQIFVRGISPDQIRQALVLAIFSFVGFETAASLGIEADKPLTNIPRAISASVVISGLFFAISSYALVLSFAGTNSSLGQCDAPLMVLAKLVGLPALGYVANFGIMISFFAAGLAGLTAGARTLLAMSHGGHFHSDLGRTHEENGTPHFAVIAITLLSLVPALALTLLNCPLIDIVGWFGSLATYGVVFAYISVSIASGILLKRQGQLTLTKLLVVIGAVTVMALALIGSVFPLQAYPYNLLPIIFVIYMVLAVFWPRRSQSKSTQSAE